MNENYKKVLGLDEFEPKTKYVCFLPFRGEFGWYLMTFVKRVHGFNHNNIIVCTKPGHESLFPKAKNFFYDWQDISDNLKAGVHYLTDEDVLKKNICQYFSLSEDDITFLYPQESSWEEKSTLAKFSFIPKPKKILDLQVDVMIAPRNRIMDQNRNWSQDAWDYVVNRLYYLGISVGICGQKETSFDCKRAKYRAWEMGDIEGDLNIILNSKCCILQESGLAYLTYMCEKPVLFVGHYHRDFGADLHRNQEIFFKEVHGCLNNPDILVDSVIEYLKLHNELKAREQLIKE